MKKMYLTPLVEVVKMETEVMICQSDGNAGFGPGSGKPSPTSLDLDFGE